MIVPLLYTQGVGGFDPVTAHRPKALKVRARQLPPSQGLTEWLRSVHAESDPSGSNPKAPTMAEKLNWHDAHALMLIDQALDQGRLTDELVEQIAAAFHDAESADRRDTESSV